MDEVLVHGELQAADEINGGQGLNIGLNYTRQPIRSYCDLSGNAV